MDLYLRSFADKVLIDNDDLKLQSQDEKSFVYELTGGSSLPKFNSSGTIRFGEVVEDEVASKDNRWGKKQIPVLDDLEAEEEEAILVAVNSFLCQIA